MSPRRSHRGRGLLRLLLAAASLVSGPVQAGHTHFLLRGETICDRAQRLCIDGSLLHHDLSNVILFTGRIVRTTEPGRVILRLAGTTPAGLPAVVEFRFDVDGRYSEIIERKMIPDFPSQTVWEVSGLFFEPDAEEPAR